MGRFPMGKDTYSRKTTTKPSQGFPPPERIPEEEKSQSNHRNAEYYRVKAIVKRSPVKTKPTAFYQNQKRLYLGEQVAEKIQVVHPMVGGDQILT